MIKLTITDFKKIPLYGDCELISDTRYRYAFRGKCIKIKILGLFWVNYRTWLI